MNRSRLVMLLMLAVAAVFAAISVAFYHSMTRRVIRFWGTDETRLVMDAPIVEALRLWPPPAKPPTADSSQVVASAQEMLSFPGGEVEIFERRDVTAAGGLEALKHGLLEDANYEWAADPSTGPRQWQYALEFSDGPKRRTVLFDFKNHVMARAETGATVALADSAASWEKFFTDVFAAPR